MESGRCTRDVMGAPHLGNRERDGHSVLGLEGGQENWLKERVNGIPTKTLT